MPEGRSIQEEKAMIKIILAATILALDVFMYACCISAHNADEDSEKMYRKYLEWKEKKKEEEKWKE